jgi:hypothetical protein
VNIVILLASATICTGLGTGFLLRPDGAGGCDTTAAISYALFTSLAPLRLINVFKQLAAKSGVPRNTIFFLFELLLNE